MGIGRSVAVMLAAHGAKVVVNARTTAAVNFVVDEIHSAGGTAIGIAGPVNDESFAKELINGCVAEFGSIDILVNNAAIYGAESIGEVANCSTDTWRQTFAVNLDGPFYLSRAALPYMIAQGWGRILNAGSLAGTGKIGGSAYSVSKAALAGFTRALAADYGPYGITVNGYNPEAITAMGNTVDRESYHSMLKHLENRGYRSASDTAYSFGAGGPEGVAPWVTYLCTNDAENLNGLIFAVEARRISLIAQPDEERVLFRDFANHGPWTLKELAAFAPIAFPLRNAWPRRIGEDLEQWISA